MAAIAPFPHRYTVLLRDRHLEAPPRAPIAAGPPPQFGGSDAVWSPEELLVAAALECLWTTFEAYARRDKLAVRDVRGSAVGVLDKGPSGPTFTAIVVAFEVLVDAGDEARAHELIATAEKRCIISQALRVPVTVEPNVRVAASAA